MSTKEKANLARIRDNQRRSRARRKEYLQELEARLRQCELQGIEASSEIQIAARRVADENKKLRELLAQHGVSEKSIDTHLQSSSISDATIGGSSASIQALEQLLQTRKSCCADGNNPPAGAGNIGFGSRGSSSSASTAQFTPPPRESRQSGGTLQSSRKATSSTHQFITPSASTASQTSSVVSGQNSRALSTQYHTASVQMPRNPGHHPLSSRNQQMFEFIDNQMSMATQRHFQPTNDAQRHIQPQLSREQWGRTNMNNCGFATEMITSMAAVDPALVRADLGCIDPAMDCEVDNHVVFDVMDQYTGHAG